MRAGSRLFGSGYRTTRGQRNNRYALLFIFTLVIDEFCFIGVQNPGVRFIWKDEIDRRKAMRIEATPTIPVSQGNVFNVDFLCSENDLVSDRPNLSKLPNEVMQFETLEKILEMMKERYVHFLMKNCHFSPVDYFRSKENESLVEENFETGIGEVAVADTSIRNLSLASGKAIFE